MTNRHTPADTGSARRFAGAMMTALGLAVATADAQVKPEKTYYGKNRQMPMTVTIPEGVTGNAEIHLLRSVTAEVVSKAPVEAGRVDLASLFPQLWQGQGPGVVYAQLVVNDTRIGPAVVLTPMITPARMTTGPSPDSPPVARPGVPVFSGIRASVDVHIVMTTTAGEIVFRMRPDQAPNTTWSFIHLADGGFYDDIIFHRIIGPRGGRPGFVIQGGDPTGAGSGGPGFQIDLEPSRLPHDFGVLSMARSQDLDSAGSQFFICLSREGTHFLDERYTSFGEAVSGAEVIRALGAVPTGPQDRPIEPPRILSMKVVEAPPYGTGPAPLSQQAAAPQPR
ncbi:MAG: peptidylprolyl isomerase [Phycisphaeraceae bacterium]|nr:peptidylprolyl isomerase [Phycisphaeraceae bacterium]MCW5753726.1 peptidylprolyl isomerase [Phycisphaeraceae bacterium]